MNRNTLFTIGAFFLVAGVISLIAANRMLCVLGECILITSGDNVFNARGISLGQGTGNFLKILPYLLFGAGIALFAGGASKRSGY